MKEKFRDKSRDNLAKLLNSIGIKATMAERNRLEEKINKPWYMRSLGIIDISSEGPIKWTNNLKKDGNDKSGPVWHVVLGIPDKTPVSKIKLRTIRKKDFPIFGDIIDTVWRGNDDGTSLINTLSDDPLIKKTAKEIGNLTVETDPKKFEGWTLKIDRNLAGNRYKQHKFTRENWEALEKIANYLLSSPRKA